MWNVEKIDVFGDAYWRCFKELEDGSRTYNGGLYEDVNAAIRYAVQLQEADEREIQ